MSNRYRIAATVYAVFLLGALCTPGPARHAPHVLGLTTAAHVTLFGGFAALLGVGMWRARRHSLARTVWAPVVIATLYGALTEVIQVYVPLRTFGWDDIVADAAGALLAQGVLWRFVYLGRRRTAPVRRTQE